MPNTAGAQLFIVARAAMKGTMADSTIVTLRLPKALLVRADALIPLLQENERLLVVGNLSRSVVLRLAVIRGLEALEAEAPEAPPRPRVKARGKP
jgi:hypothetical protein